jgi:hypothetical protein
MKDKFIGRYKAAVINYFNATDNDGRMVRSYVFAEYEKILEEEFGMSHEEVRKIYDELYIQKYGKEMRA